MSIFIKPTDTFPVKLTTGVSATNKAVTYAAESKEDLLKAFPNATDIENHELTFHFPTFKDNVKTVDDSIELVEGKFEFRSTALRLHRMIRLLDKWSFKDELGEPVPVTPETIGALHPIVATFVAAQMEEVLGVL